MKHSRRENEGFAFRQKILRLLADMEVDEKIPLGHQLEDLVLECEYNGYICETE